MKNNWQILDVSYAFWEAPCSNQIRLGRNSQSLTRSSKSPWLIKLQVHKSNPSMQKYIYFDGRLFTIQDRWNVIIKLIGDNWSNPLLFPVSSFYPYYFFSLTLFFSTLLSFFFCLHPLFFKLKYSHDGHPISKSRSRMAVWRIFLGYHYWNIIYLSPTYARSTLFFFHSEVYVLSVFNYRNSEFPSFGVHLSLEY